MEINKALAPLGIPVCHPPYSGGERTYVTYQLMGQSGTFYAESQEAETGMGYSVDLYTEGDYVAVIHDIKAALEDAGYSCVVDQEIYEQNTGLRHIAMSATTPEEVYG